MWFFQAYKDVGDGKIVSLGPLRANSDEALADLQENGYLTDHLKPDKFGTYYSPNQQVGVSSIRI